MYASIKGYNRINVESAQRIQRRKSRKEKEIVGKRVKTTRRVALRDLVLEEA
jgi:hypothetical protein